MTMTPLNRAKKLARRMGVETRAESLKGILRACKSASYAPQKFPPKKALPMAPRITPADLARPWKQERARVRRCGPYLPLIQALSAALGAPQIENISNVPNSYRGTAEESVCSAKRQGQAVRVSWERAIMGKTSHGTGSRPYYPTNQFVLARDLLRWVAPPRGYRWRVDDNGPYVTGPDVDDYHVSGNDLALIIQSTPQARAAMWQVILNVGRENTAARKLQRAATRRERLLARISTKLAAKIQDATECGYCQAGIATWRQQAGIDPSATEIPLRDLFAVATKTGERRALTVAYHVARKALRAQQGV